MRIRLAAVAALAVLGWAISPSWSALPPPGKNVSPQTLQNVADLRLRGPLPPRRAGPISTAVPMSASDCSDLGGRIVADWVGVCASKKVCTRTDNYGHDHSVCLSVQ